MQAQYSSRKTFWHAHSCIHGELNFYAKIVYYINMATFYVSEKIIYILKQKWRTHTHNLERESITYLAC